MVGLRPGCRVYSTPEGRRWSPAFKVIAVDTTAAGDAFNAGFAVSLIKGKTPLEAARYAAAVAAISVTRKGAQPSMPSAREVATFLRQQSLESSA